MLTATLDFTSKINPVPFSRMSYKGIRVFGRFLELHLYALGSLIVSAAYRIFNQDLAYIYLLTAKTYLYQAFSIKYTYLNFEKNLINFSCNTCIRNPFSGSKEDALRTFYGDRIIDDWFRIGTEEIPLKLENVKYKEVGLCCGMSLDFIKHYLEQVQVGVLPITAIDRVSSRYVNGAPEEAFLTHIFYTALDVSSLLDRKKKELIRWREKIDPQLEGLQNSEEIHKKLRIFITETYRAAAWPRLQIIGKQLGFQMEEAQYYIPNESCSESLIDLNGFVEKLSDGAHFATLFSDEGNHTFNIIKSNGQFFLFDPNFGTLIFERNAIAMKLWELWFKGDYSYNPYLVAFSSCKLSHDFLAQ